MECITPFFGIAFIAVILLISMAQAQKHKDALKALADTHEGLRVYDDEVRGEVRGVSIRIDTYTTGSGKNKSTWTRFRVSDPSSLHAQQVAAEGLFSGMGKLLGGEDVQIGDPAADGKLLLRGSEDEIVARMSAEARPKVMRAVTRGWEHEQGTWTYRRRGKMTNVSEMRAILAHGFEVTTALRMEGNRQQVLVQRALTDPLESARVRALEVRLKSGPLASTDEERLAASGGMVGVVVAEAMGMRGIPALKHAIQTGHGDTRLRAALALARLGEGDVAVRAILRQALSDEVVQVPVIRALAEVGTVEEVPALAPIADGWMSSNRHLAKNAIRTIQSRITGAGVGQLSLAGSGGGDLSLAGDGQAGTLSEASAEAERARARNASQRQREG